MQHMTRIDPFAARVSATHIWVLKDPRGRPTLVQTRPATQAIYIQTVDRALLSADKRSSGSGRRV